MEVEIAFLRPSILQGDFMQYCKYLLKRSFWLPLQVSNNFGSTGSGSATPFF